MIDPDIREKLADMVCKVCNNTGRIQYRDGKPPHGPCTTCGKDGGGIARVEPPPPFDPIIDSQVDIPLERIARELRKRSGRAFGLGDDAKANELRDLCTRIEKLARGDAPKVRTWDGDKD